MFNDQKPFLSDVILLSLLVPSSVLNIFATQLQSFADVLTLLHCTRFCAFGSLTPQFLSKEVRVFPRKFFYGGGGFFSTFQNSILWGRSHKGTIGVMRGIIGGACDLWKEGDIKN